MQMFLEQDSLKNILKNKSVFQWVIIIFCFVSGLGVSIFAIFNLLTVTEEEIVTSGDIDSQVCERSADFGEMTVFISGAIKNPGLYILPFESRIADLVQEAGGLLKTVDLVYVHKKVNFAKKLSDADQIYIPTKSESITEFERNLVANENRLISINSSTLEELMSLEGIGEVRAKKIIENRPYSAVRELIDKNVVSESLFGKIKAKISL